MREQNRAAARVRLQAGDDVLEEGVIGASLRRRAVQVAPVGVVLPRAAVPLLDGIRRIGEHHVELLQAVVGAEMRVGERVAAHDVEVLEAVHEQVHARDGRGHQVDFLAIELQRAVFPSLALELLDGTTSASRQSRRSGRRRTLPGCGSSIRVIRWTTVRLV